MPCYTTTTVSADVSKWNQDRAAEAIKLTQAAGEGYSVRLVNGKLEANSDAEINKVKQQYAALTLKAAAKRFNWTTASQTTTKTGLIQLNLARR